MFKAMNECQLLHPDPNDSLSEDEEDEDGDAEGDVYDVAGAERVRGVPLEVRGNGQSQPQDEEMQDEEGQFDDADE